MKKITIALILAFLCGFSADMTVQANKKKETPVLIRELIERIKHETEIDDARYPELIREVEAEVASCNKPEEAAILHSLIAEMYSGFESRNSWKFRQRTPISGYIPEDINEWTSNLFSEKIREEYLLSLQPAELLQQTPISRYAEILQPGKDEDLRPALYDYLIYRVLEVNPTEQLYRELIGYKRKANNPKALMLAELDYLNFKNRGTVFDADPKTLLSSLDSLHTVYAAYDFSAEIWIQRVERMQSITYLSEKPDSHPINKELIDLCRQAIRQYPGYERTGFFKNTLASMENPTIQVSMPSVTYPGNEIKLNITYRNLENISIKVYETGQTPEQINEQAYLPSAKKEQQKVTRKLVRQISCNLEIPNIYQHVDTTVWISGPEKTGIYEYEISADDLKLESRQYIYVSKLLSVSRPDATDGAEILVTDLQTGKPVEKATVLLYNSKQGKVTLVDSIQTDINGIASIQKRNNINYFRPVYKEDRDTPLTPVYWGSMPFRGSIQTQADAVSLFTDRGLYRPGQTVFVKGIVYSNDKDRQSVIPNRTVNVILRDANYKEIATRKFTTNEFGSFNGEFTLPKNGLNGYFSLSAENTTVSLRVEEYKRPSFNVEINPVKDEIAFGDTVRISGKAQTYSGVALQSGTVSYRVVKWPFRFAYYPNKYTEFPVLYGETELDANGTFHFDFVPEKTEQGNFVPLYNSYEVVATVSDSKGETQETSFFFPVGNASIVLSCNLSGIVKNENLSVQVKAQTLSGEPVQTKGGFILYSLREKKNIKTGIVEKEKGEEVAKGSFTTESPLDKGVFGRLPSGGYRLRLEASDSKGRPAEFEQDVVLYTDRDKHPPVFSDIWMPEDVLHCLPGETAQFVFGTSHKKAYILYEIIVGDKVITRKRLELSNENRRISVPFTDNYGDGVTALFTFTKEGKLYTKQLPVYKRRPDKRLAIKTETFRDKLLPGNKETWKLKVLTPDSLPATAEILASMYDASLDAIMPFSWRFFPEKTPYLSANSFRNNQAYWDHTNYVSGTIKNVDVPYFEYSRLDFMQAIFTYGQQATAQSMSLRAMKSAAPVAYVAEESLAENAVVHISSEVEDSGMDAGGGNKEVSLRKNFNETAFFYPVLRTDSAGNFVVSFTLPESNTTWKFQTLAHTKDMSYGQLAKEVISSKPLMVLPNLPRFVRRGDEVSISAQVINRSEETLDGRVRLELFDPATDETVVCLTKSQMPFDLEAGKQATVNWTIPIPAGYDLLGVRIIADSETVSDGEQHLLPVLSNEVLVTESTPIYLKGEEEKEITLPKPAGTSYRPYRQTLEISANPIWYAVQALPNLARPADNSASAWFASYYSNTLASFIVKANPRIRTVIGQWSANGGDAASLLSNLEKNEELKNIVLEETPWILEAESETEQIQRLSLLFDLNRSESQRAEALQELIRLQREDGAWGWFSGFGADRYVTTAILQGMADLVRLNAIQYGQEEKVLQMNALKYLDRRIKDDFEQLKKLNSKWKDATPDEVQLAYILMRSSYRDIPEAAETREAIRFYTGQAEKQWEKLPLRMKVQTALLLQRNGKKDKAQTIMNWFKRTATASAEQGLFWANNRRNGFSPVSPIETHALLMSAFDEIQVSGVDVEQMKQWLLNQKRTQSWETTPGTLNAVYALLLAGQDWLAENNRVVINWGKDTIDTKQGSTGIGYTRKVRNASEITADNKVAIRKEGSTPAWGAFYNQYFAPADQVRKQTGDLGIEKKLFVERASATGAELVLLKEGETLKVGEKAVVRLTIRTKQEMTYVHLKDMRAGCFEPVDQLSGTQYRDGISFYRTAKDASEHFYFDRLPQGTFVIEYGVYISRTGEYTNGPADIQCLYAPEYTAHTEGGRIIIKD